jgi:hypothetical protein
MVDRSRASVIARRAAEGIPRTQTDTIDTEPARRSPETSDGAVRISARISTGGRDALRRLGAAHGLSVAALVDLLAGAAEEDDPSLRGLVAVRAERHRRPWGGRR